MCSLLLIIIITEVRTQSEHTEAMKSTASRSALYGVDEIKQEID